MSNPEGTASRESHSPRRTAAAPLPAALARPQDPLLGGDGGRAPRNLPQQDSGAEPGGRSRCSPAGWAPARNLCWLFPATRRFPPGWDRSQTLGRPTTPLQLHRVLPPASTPGEPPRCRPCWAAPTCRDEEDAGAEDDVVFALVELAGRHAEAPEEQQTHAEDGEDAGRSHRTCGTGSRAGSAPGIAPATGAAGISHASAREGLVAMLDRCHEGWGHPAPVPPVLVPELLCSELAPEPSTSPANPGTPASRHTNTLHPEFLFFPPSLLQGAISSRLVAQSALATYLPATKHPIQGLRLRMGPWSLGTADPPRSHQAASHQGQETVPWVPKLSRLLQKSRIYKLTHPKFNKKLFSDVGEGRYENEQEAQDPEPTTCDAVAPALGSVPKAMSSAGPVSARSGVSDRACTEKGLFYMAWQKFSFKVAVKIY